MSIDTSTHFIDFELQGKRRGIDYNERFCAFDMLIGAESVRCLIEMETGAGFLSNSALAKVCGVETRNLRAYLRKLKGGAPSVETPTQQGVKGGLDISFVMTPTPGGEQSALLNDEGAILAAISHFNPILLINADKLAVRLMLHNRIGIQYEAKPPASQKPRKALIPVAKRVSPQPAPAELGTTLSATETDNLKAALQVFSNIMQSTAEGRNPTHSGMGNMIKQVIQHGDNFVETPTYWSVNQWIDELYPDSELDSTTTTRIRVSISNWYRLQTGGADPKLEKDAGGYVYSTSYREIILGLIETEVKRSTLQSRERSITVLPKPVKGALAVEEAKQLRNVAMMLLPDVLQDIQACRTRQMVFTATTIVNRRQVHYRTIAADYGLNVFALAQTALQLLEADGRAIAQGKDTWA
jgi:hypothetical protein